MFGAQYFGQLVLGASVAFASPSTATTGSGFGTQYFGGYAGQSTPAPAPAEEGGGAPRRRRRYEADAECNILHRFRITADGRALVLAGAEVSRAIVLAVNVSTANVWAGGEAPIEHETTTTAGKASAIAAGEASMEHRSASHGGAYALAPESLAAEQEADDELALIASLKL